MPASCTRCDAPLSSDAGFCPACGAPVSAASTPPTQPAPSPSAAPYTQAAPRQGGGALKIILIVIAVIIGIGVLGLGTLGFMGYRAFHKAGATFAAGGNAAVSDDEFGVAIYPGAVRMENSAMRVKVGNHGMTTAAYTTPDPTSSVISFYKDKLGGDVQVKETVAGTQLQNKVGSTVNGHLLVTVRANPEGNGTRFVLVREEGSGS